MQGTTAALFVLVQWGLWRAEKHHREMWMMTCGKGRHSLQMPKGLKDTCAKQQCGFGSQLPSPAKTKGCAKERCWPGCDLEDSAAEDSYTAQYAKHRRPAGGGPDAGINKAGACQSLPENKVLPEAFAQPKEGQSFPLAHGKEEGSHQPLLLAVSPVASESQIELEKDTSLRASMRSQEDLHGPSKLKKTAMSSAAADVVNRWECLEAAEAGQCDVAVHACPGSSTYFDGVQAGWAVHTELAMARGHGRDEALDQKAGAARGCDWQPSCSQSVECGIFPQGTSPGSLKPGQGVCHRLSTGQVMRVRTFPASSVDLGGITVAAQQQSIREAEGHATTCSGAAQPWVDGASCQGCLDGAQSHVAYSHSQARVERHSQVARMQSMQSDTLGSVHASLQATLEVSVSPKIVGTASEAELESASGVLKLDGSSALQGDVPDARVIGICSCVKEALVPLPKGSFTEIQPASPARQSNTCCKSQACSVCTCSSMSECASGGILSPACSVVSDGMPEPQPLSVVTAMSRGISSLLLYVAQTIVGGGFPQEAR